MLTSTTHLLANVQGMYVTFAQLRPSHTCDSPHADVVPNACVDVQVITYKYSEYSILSSVRRAVSIVFGNAEWNICVRKPVSTFKFPEKHLM